MTGPVISVRFRHAQDASLNMTLVLEPEPRAQKESTMNTRIRQTLASILAAAAVTFGAPLLSSAQEAPRVESRVESRGVRMLRMQQLLQLDEAQTARVRQIMRGARAQHRALRASNALRDAHHALRVSTMAQIRATLRADQQQRLDAAHAHRAQLRGAARSGEAVRPRSGI